MSPMLVSLLAVTSTMITICSTFLKHITFCYDIISLPTL